MIHHYLRVSLRILRRNVTTSVINITGLVIGMTGLLLIGLYALDEFAYDQHFSRIDQMYRVTSGYSKDGNDYTSAQTFASIASSIIDQYPEVEHATRMLPADEGFFFFNGTALKEAIIYTDSTFTKVFDINLLMGNADKCLVNPSSVIVSRSFAEKLYGNNWRNSDLLTETLMIDGSIPIHVTGVFEDLPEHTHFNSRLFASVPSGNESWIRDRSMVYTYLVVRERANVTDLVRKIASASAALGFDEPGNRVLGLQPVSDIHLNTGLEDENATTNSIYNIYVLSGVGIALVIISILNFMNLAAAGAITRQKEVGVRKAIGASAIHLRYQFFTETFVVTLTAIVMSALLGLAALPLVNDISGKHMTALMILDPVVMLIFLGLAVGVSILACAYPLLYLPQLRVLAGLKKIVPGRSGAPGWRRGLVVLQLSVSCVMICLSTVALKQADLISRKPLGFDKTRVVVLSNPYMLGSIENLLRFKTELARISGVEHVSITGYTPSQNRWGIRRLTFGGRDKQYTQGTYATWLTVDEDFISTLGIKLIAGRYFEDPGRESDVVVVNETAAKLFGIAGNNRTGVGDEISVQTETDDSSTYFNVIGVVEDFNFASLHEAVMPVVMRAGYHRFEMAVRLSETFPETKVLKEMETVWKTHLPAIPFEYTYLKTRFDQLHETDVAQGKIFSAFCAAIIVISGFGLFSMVTYAIINRTKEIGVRKVLGASGSGIAVLVGKEFLVLILTCYLVSLPVAWIICHSWIERFAYRTEISWPVFLTSFVVILLVGAAALSYQTIKAVTSNPIDALRHE